MAPNQSTQKKQDQQQKSPRKKTMAQKIQSKPSYDRKAKHPDYVQFRCNVNAFNNMITDIKDKLNERQKEMLQKTPFWNLIEPFYNQRIDMRNMTKSDIDLVKLIKQFDPTTKSFTFGNKAFKITSKVVTQILGLPNEGKRVKLDKDKYEATFRTRNFGDKRPYKARLEEQIHKAIDLSNKLQKQGPKTKTNEKSKKRKSKNQTGEEEKEEEEVVDYDMMWSAQNVIEAFIQMEEKIDPMETCIPQYMSSWTWQSMSSFEEPDWQSYV